MRNNLYSSNSKHSFNLLWRKKGTNNRRNYCYQTIFLKSKEKKVEIEAVQQGYSEQLKMLNEKIDALDTNKKYH